MHQIELKGGVLEYQDVGHGPPVVLLHGAHMNESLWSGVVAELSADHRCIVPVIPIGGHRVPMPADADQTAGGVASLLVDFLEQLDLESVTLVGNDTGGALAQLLVNEQPKRVGRLVLASCDAFDNWPPGLPGKVSALAGQMPGGLMMAGQLMRSSAMARLPLTWGWMAKQPIPREVLDSWFSPLRQQREIRRDTGKFMRSLDKRDMIDAAEKLRSFDRPTLLVWAAEDKVMPRAHADRLADGMPDARVVDVTDSYTLMPLDQPAKLAELIATFIRERA